MPKVLSLEWETTLEIQLAIEDKHFQPEDILELFQRLQNDVQNIHKELGMYINTSNWDRLIICYDDDDDQDYAIAIIPSLSTKEPDNSLSMGDEHLDTISAIESDEFIKFSIENLIPIPSESEGIPDNMCDVPFHDNSPPLNVSKDQFEDFSDSNDAFSSTDDDSFSIDNIEVAEVLIVGYEHVVMNCGSSGNRPNGEALRKCLLSHPYKPTTVLVQAVAATDDSPAIHEHTTVETPMNIDEIYSTVDACQTAQEMWEAIKRLQQGESLNIQDVKTNLFLEFVNVQFIQQLQPEWLRFVTIVKQQHKLDEVSYHKIFDILKQYQKEVNELRAERLDRNANSLALVATAQANHDSYYQTSKSHKSYAPSSKPSILTRSHITTRCWE
nr:hypothetical protein [Tanacetum cinerariifolium]